MPPPAAGPAGPSQEQAAGEAQWRLAGWTQNGKQVKLPSGVEVTLAFSGGNKLSGQAPVNRYFGGYVRTEQGNLRLTGPIGATRMAGPPELMDLEQAYLDALARVTTVQQSAGRLTLRDAKNRIMLEFEPK